MNPTLHQLVVTRDFNVSRERLWHAWTQPKQVKAWLSLGEDVTIESVQMDLRVGGKFRIQTRMKDGEYFTAAGRYLEVTPPDKLVYTWDWEKDGAGLDFGELEGTETQLTIEFRPIPNGTKLVLTQEKFDSAARRDRHVTGWTEWLGRMAKFIDANPAHQE